MGDELIRFCAHEYSTLDARDTRWPEAIHKRGLGWCLTGDLPNIQRNILLELIRSGFKRFEQIGSVRFSEVDVASAHIVMTTRRIDGPGGTLAWSNLPPSNPCEQAYDTGEGWNQKVNFLPVMKHEVGHAMGLQHDPQPGALLSAYYDPSIQDFTERDISRYQTLYGPPAINPSPPGEPGWNPGAPVVIRIEESDLVMLEIKGARRISIPGFNVTPKTE